MGVEPGEWAGLRRSQKFLGMLKPVRTNEEVCPLRIRRKRVCPGPYEMSEELAG